MRFTLLDDRTDVFTMNDSPTAFAMLGRGDAIETERRGVTVGRQPYWTVLLDDGRMGLIRQDAQVRQCFRAVANEEIPLLAAPNVDAPEKARIKAGQAFYLNGGPGEKVEGWVPVRCVHGEHGFVAGTANILDVEGMPSETAAKYRNLFQHEPRMTIGVVEYLLAWLVTLPLGLLLFITIFVVTVAMSKAILGSGSSQGIGGLLGLVVLSLMTYLARGIASTLSWTRGLSLEVRLIEVLGTIFN